MNEEQQRTAMGLFCVLYPKRAECNIEALRKQYIDEFIEEIFDIGLHELINRYMFMAEHGKKE